jgi:alpha-ketoglutarate-dependent taurine dioxygenase
MSVALEPAARVTVQPLSGFTGAEITGIDLREPLDDAAVAGIQDALNKWKVVFFRDQHLTHGQHVAFARRFGKPTVAHPYDAHSPHGHPEVRTISSATTTGRRGETWHTDLTGVLNPPSGSVLRAQQLPPYGGDTIFCNLAAAYRGLSEPVRRLADQLSAQHRFGGRDGFSTGQNSVYSRKVAANPSVTEHPVVRVHPLTGERVLFVNPTFTTHIVGVSREESEHLLALLYTEILRPEYSARFRWTPGSVAFWDNRATVHAGPAPFEFEHLGVERIMYRITLEGEVPVGVDGRVSRAIEGGRFEALAGAAAA